MDTDEKRALGLGKLCCSKKIVLTSYIFTALLTLVTILCVFLGNCDPSPLSGITALAWAETTACNAFYFWKAKNENRIKLTEKMVHDLADKYGIDAVVSLVSTIIRD